MQFCPKCGSILIQKKDKLRCLRCNYISKEKVKLEIKEKIVKEREIGVVKEKDVDILPLVDEECPKCKNSKAYFWTSQTRAGDEAETKFFRCQKCEHTWREYR